MTTALHPTPSMSAIRRPFDTLLRSLRAPAVAPGTEETIAAQGEICAARCLLPIDVGSAYIHILAAEAAIARAKQAITLHHGAAVIAALAAGQAEEVGVPAGFDCAVTAHPAGGYALLWAADRTMSGRYATPENARREARMNGYRCYDRREPSPVALPR
jgi:hypothetical protein